MTSGTGGGINEVDEDTAAELMELAQQAREPGRWTQYDDLKITPFIGMEQEATSITCFGMISCPPCCRPRTTPGK